VAKNSSSPSKELLVGATVVVSMVEEVESTAPGAAATEVAATVVVAGSEMVLPF